MKHIIKEEIHFYHLFQFYYCMNYLGPPLQGNKNKAIKSNKTETNSQKIQEHALL